MGGVGVLLDVVYHRETVHHRHGDVGKDEVGHLVSCHYQAFLAVFGKQYIIVCLEDGEEELAQVGVVFYDEDGDVLFPLFSFVVLFCLFYFLEIAFGCLVADAAVVLA